MARSRTGSLSESPELRMLSQSAWGWPCEAQEVNQTQRLSRFACNNGVHGLASQTFTFVS